MTDDRETDRRVEDLAARAEGLGVQVEFNANALLAINNLLGRVQALERLVADLRGRLGVDGDPGIDLGPLDLEPPAG